MTEPISPEEFAALREALARFAVAEPDVSATAPGDVIRAAAKQPGQAADPSVVNLKNDRREVVARPVRGENRDPAIERRLIASRKKLIDDAFSGAEQIDLQSVDLEDDGRLGLGLLRRAFGKSAPSR